MPTISGLQNLARTSLNNDGKVDGQEAQKLIDKASSGPQSYTVQAGDWLSKIARNNNCSVADLMAANPQISDPNQISEGQEIKLPGQADETALKAELKAFFEENKANFDADAKAKIGNYLGVAVDNTPAPTAEVGQPSDAGTGSAMDVRLGRVDTTTPVADTQQASDLGPTNSALPLTSRMAEVTKAADDILDLGAINAEFNPLSDVIGQYSKPSEVYQGKVLVPVQKLIGGAIQSQIKGKLEQAGIPADQMQAAMDQEMAKFAPLLGSLNDNAELRNSSHQFNVDGEVGNRVTLYGGDFGHSHIDQVVDEMGKQHIRGFKIMSHINHEGQGGKVEDVLGDGVLGVTHTGGFSSGVRGGAALAIKSDWPSDYGSMSNSNKTYNAVLVGVDYQAGTQKEVPEKFLEQYKHNADMWDVAGGMTVPFASQDPDSRHTNYKFNPLEVHDHESAVSVGDSLAKLDWDAMKGDGHGAFYCAEGQFSIASLGPKDELLIKQSKFNDTPLGNLINAYQEAVTELEANPEKAWELLKEGKVINEEEFADLKDTPISLRDWPQAGWLSMADTGAITKQQYQHLANTDRDATYMEWVPEDTQGWEKFDPHQADGLVATPMTVATMGWGLIRSTMPRTEVAKTVAGDLMKAYKEGDDMTKGLIKGLLKGHAPDTAQGQGELQKLGMKAATGLLLNAIGSDEFKTKMLQKSGFDEIIDEQIADPDRPGQQVSSKELVERTFDKFLDALKDPALMADQAAMDARIMEIDNDFRSMNITRSAWNPVDGNHSNTVKGPMVYAAPNSMLFFSRNPDLFDSQAMRYVTNLQHVAQAGQE